MRSRKDFGLKLGELEPDRTIPIYAGIKVMAPVLQYYCMLCTVAAKCPCIRRVIFGISSQITNPGLRNEGKKKLILFCFGGCKNAFSVSSPFCFMSIKGLWPSGKRIVKNRGLANLRISALFEDWS